jgi:hypothetical protein
MIQALQLQKLCSHGTRQKLMKTSPVRTCLKTHPYSQKWAEKNIWKDAKRSMWKEPKMLFKKKNTVLLKLQNVAKGYELFRASAKAFLRGNVTDLKNKEMLAQLQQLPNQTAKRRRGSPSLAPDKRDH